MQGWSRWSAAVGPGPNQAGSFALHYRQSPETRIGAPHHARDKFADRPGSAAPPGRGVHARIGLPRGRRCRAAARWRRSARRPALCRWQRDDLPRLLAERDTDRGLPLPPGPWRAPCRALRAPPRRQHGGLAGHGAGFDHAQAGFRHRSEQPGQTVHRRVLRLPRVGVRTGRTARAGLRAPRPASSPMSTARATASTRTSCCSTPTRWRSATTTSAARWRRR